MSGLVGQDLDRLHDLANAGGRGLDLNLGSVVEKAFEIFQDFGGEFDAGHTRRSP